MYQPSALFLIWGNAGQVLNGYWIRKIYKEQKMLLTKYTHHFIYCFNTLNETAKYRGKGFMLQYPILGIFGGASVADEVLWLLHFREEAVFNGQNKLLQFFCCNSDCHFLFCHSSVTIFLWHFKLQHFSLTLFCGNFFVAILIATFYLPQ